MMNFSWGKKKGKDSKYFTSSSRGEVVEWKNDLHSQKKSTVIEAVKKVIAAMTVGKDVSMLFADVTNCMQTDNTELKKLVYLYLINYAKTNPDTAIVTVNTFVKDTTHRSPLVRALAVRTMGCMRVEKITEYLVKPLQRCLNDEDPYVKKTAAMCVAKLYDSNPTLVKEQGFLDQLRDLICDANPMVVANAVAALSEIEDASGKPVLTVTDTVLSKLLAALNECSEWGQVFILDFLAKYKPSDSEEAEMIIERVVPRLGHSNSAVVLSAVKIVMRYLPMVTSTDAAARFGRKLSPPLVTLAHSSQPEIQFVALRNISLIVQRRPDLLARSIKTFFCKYNDPIYVKMEKLEVLTMLASESNIDSVLSELKEYASEVDVDFVRKSVRTIGRLAIKIERAAERCIKALLGLIQTQVNYVVQEAVIVIKDIFRKYPNRYESVIRVLCEALDTLDEPEAKASMIWIIGEYAGRIENAHELLGTFLEAFHDEPAMVQLQLLTATVKLFLRQPSKGQPMVTRVLTMATEQSDNPDLRDRGYVYWRLLSSKPQAAKQVVLAERPVISDDTNALDPSLLDNLIGNIATLASVYHKPPESFVTRARVEPDDDDSTVYSSDEDEDGEDGAADAGTGAGMGAGTGAGAVAPAATAAPSDLLDLGFGSAPTTAAAAAPVAAAPPVDPLGDLFAPVSAPAPAPAAAAPTVVPTLPQLGTVEGLTVFGGFVRANGAITLNLQLQNATSAPVADCALKVNKNSFGVTPRSDVINFGAAPGGTGSASVPCDCLPTNLSGGPPNLLVDAAIRHNASNKVIMMRGIQLPFQVMFGEDGAMDEATYIAQFKAADASNDVVFMVDGSVTTDLGSSLPALQQKLQAANVFYIAQRLMNDNTVVFFSLKLVTGQVVQLELTFRGGITKCQVRIKSPNPTLSKMVQSALEGIMTGKA